MSENREGPTRASKALKRWMTDTATSQVRLAQLVTEKLGRLAKTPVNQSTISAWTRGVYQPGGQGMVAIQEITGIPVTEWIVPADDSSPAIVVDADTDAA